MSESNASDPLRASGEPSIALPAWALPLIVAAIIVPPVAGFVIAGAGLGLALGFLSGVAVAVIAVRLRPRGTIETAPAGDLRRRVLIVVTHELDDPGAIEAIKREHELTSADVNVRVLAPARGGRLDRWASDDRSSRAEAQRKLVLSVAALGKADIAADAALGDEDLVQAVEDELRSYPATELILVSERSEGGADRAATELEERLRQPLSHVVLGS